MTPEAFKRAITNGLGRVVLYLQTHDAAPYREIILEACVHGGGYDRQIEGSHSDYLFEIIRLTNDKEYFRDAVLEALRNATEQGWGMVHLMDMAKYFAMEGDAGARQAMYEKFTAELSNDYWVGGSSIIEVDGIDGFLFVADQLGQLALDDDEFEDDEYYWICLKHREPEVPEDELKAALDRARAGNPRVDAYLSKIDNWEPKKDRMTRKKILKLGYDGVKDYIENEPSNSDSPVRGLSWLQFWGNNAPSDQLMMAAEGLLQETDESKLIDYLQIFRHVAFPLDSTKLLDLVLTAEHVPAYAAKYALANTVDPKIREVGLKMIEEKERLDLGIELLTSNFEVRDWEMLEKLTLSTLDRETFHAVCMGVRAVFKRNPSLEGIGSLLNIYEHTPCGVCRCGVVDLMEEVERLPERIATEYKYDSYRLSS